LPACVFGPSLAAQQVARFLPANTSPASSSANSGLSPNENRSSDRQSMLLSSAITGCSSLPTSVALAKLAPKSRHIMRIPQSDAVSAELRRRSLPTGLAG